MSAITPMSSDNRQTRFVEYVDIFSQQDVIPSAAVKDNLLCFDTFDGTNPLMFLKKEEPCKVYQKLCFHVISGEIIFEINGKEETVQAPALLSIMPENIIRILSFSTDCQFFMMVFYPKLHNLVYSDVGFTYSSARLSLKHFRSSISAEEMQRSLELYKEIKQEILAPAYDFKNIYIRSLLNALTVWSINQHAYNPMPLQGDSNSRLYDVYCRFLSLLNKHSAEHRTVQFYAQQLGISSKYLSFVCISYSKKNASTWIDESVIQKAKALMLVHHYSFNDTSAILHFQTTSSFSRFFKRVTGITPKAFLQAEAT